MRRASKTPVRQCVADIAALARFEHRASNCTVKIVKRSRPVRPVSTIAAAPPDFGHSEVESLTPRSLRISTQGISGGLPFNYVLQARRVGDCTKTRFRRAPLRPRLTIFAKQGWCRIWHAFLPIGQRCPITWAAGCNDWRPFFCPRDRALDGPGVLYFIIKAGSVGADRRRRWRRSRGAIPDGAGSSRRCR